MNHVPRWLDLNLPLCQVHNGLIRRWETQGNYNLLMLMKCKTVTNTVQSTQTTNITLGYSKLWTRAQLRYALEDKYLRSKNYFYEIWHNYYYFYFH